MRCVHWLSASFLLLVTSSLGAQTAFSGDSSEGLPVPSPEAAVELPRGPLSPMAIPLVPYRTALASQNEAVRAPRANGATSATTEEKIEKKNAESNTEEPREETGRVVAVTVYRGQALVMRELEVEGPAGLREIVVTGLPDQVVPQSLYAESGNGIEVRSVRFRVRPVGEDVREEVRAIEQQMKTVQNKITAVQRQLQLAQEHKTYLDSLQNFVAPTASVELTQGVLNAETLQTLTEFQFTQRAKLAEEELKFRELAEELQNELQLLQRKRDTVAGGSARTIREAIVFVNVTEDAGGALRVRYLVNNASWAPSYNVRVDAERAGVLIEYNAAVRQTTGEDWNEVAMTLSTASPSLVATAPELTALRISLAPLDESALAEANARASDYFARKRELQTQLERFEFERSNNANLGLSLSQSGNLPADVGQPAPAIPGLAGRPASEGGMMGGIGGMGMGGMPAPTADFDSDALQQALPDMPGENTQAEKLLNSVAGQIQILDLKATKSASKATEKGAAVDATDVSVTYTLGSPISLPSRSDQQFVQIAAMPMEAEFQKVAVPVLTEHVYEHAELVNRGDVVLLSGPTSSFLAGEFVGHGQLPTVAIGERFTIGLGIDSSLRAHRELVERTDQTQGGNRIVAFTYRLSLENFGSEPARVRLLDRIPVAKEGELAVTLVSPGQDLSTDPAYEQTERKQGILRWQVEAPAEATGPDAFDLDYEFQMEYDRLMSISGEAKPE